MRVLHLLKTAVGASWALRQTRELVKLGVEVHLALPDGPMVEKYKAAGVQVHILDAGLSLARPWLNISKMRALRELVECIQPDIVHSHFVATTLLMRFALRKVPVQRIFHVPGPLHLEHWLYRNLDVKSANKQDTWLASCIWTRERYQRSGINPERVGLAYYGVNEEDFAFNPNPQLNIRQSLNLPQESFLIGMVAYFYAPKRYLGQSRGLKGHEDLIDAIAIVKKRYANVRCIFVGSPWENADDYYLQVQDYAAEKAGDSCMFLGFRSDVPDIYPQFDLAVHPSHSENVGGAVESMYAGVATVTSNVGGFPDLIQEGETGYMAPAKDPAALAEKIIQAIENPQERQRRVENGRRKVASVMNVQDNAVQVYEFYQHILAGGAAC